MRYLILALLALALASCRTSQTAKTSPKPETVALEAQYQAEIRRLNTIALQQATDKDDNHLAEALSAMPDSGAVGWAKHQNLERLKDGTPLLDPKGEPVFSTQEALGKSNSMREIQGVDAVAFTLAGVPTDPTTGGLYADKLVGLHLTLKQGSAGTGLDADFAEVWAGKTANEKQAGADAAAKYLKTKLDGRVEAIDALGRQITGILKQVYEATPVGGGLAAVRTLIQTDDSPTPTPATVVQPLLSD